MNKTFYNIYINDGLLQLISEKDVPFIILQEGESMYEVGENKSPIIEAIENLEKGKMNRVVLYHKSLDKLLIAVQSFFEIVEAAGGVVENDKKEILGIYRRKHWDFPKGKLEKDEKKKECALREVKEECGLVNLEIGKKLGNTYHVYGSAKDRKLKISTWYVMRTADKDLIPQTEEDIEIAQWFKVNDFLVHAKPIFKNIKDVFEHYLMKFH